MNEPDGEARDRLWKAGWLADERVTLHGMTWRSTLPVAAALIIGLGLLLSVQLVARPLAFLVLAIAVAEALSPLVARLERRIPRSAAIALVYLVLLIISVLLGWLVMPTIIAQGQELIGRTPEIIERVQRWIERGDRATGGQIAAALGGISTQAGSFVVSLPLQILSALVDVLLVVFLSVYWLVGAPALESFALSIFPERRHATAARIMRDTGQAMGGYVRAVAINAVLMGLMAWLGLALLGVNYALVLGVITMLFVPVPIIGAIAAAVPVVVVAYLQSPTTALLALALYTALQQVESQLLTPNIMRSQTDMPQTLIIFAVVAGGAIGGLLGILVSIPLAAALRVVVVQVVVPVVRRWTGAAPRPSDAADSARAITTDPEPRIVT